MTAQQSGRRETFLPPKTLRRLLQEQPTPFYIYDAAGLRASCRKVQEAFSWNDGFSLCFPVRMNPNPKILEKLAQAGCGALCGSEAELRLAAMAGLGGQKLLYAPAAFQEPGWSLAKKLGAVQVMDGGHMLPPQAPEEVLLSVHPEKGLRLDGRPVWNMEKCKLGMDEAELLSMGRRFASAGTKRVGLAIFLRDQESEPERFCAALDTLFSLAVRMKQELGTAVQRIFISGGLGAAYRVSEQEPDLQEISARVRTRYETVLVPAGLRPELTLAPGRLLSAKHGALVTRVLAVKNQTPPLVLLDADCAQFLREVAFGASHRMTAPLVPDGRPRQMVRAAGALADLRDHFSGTFVLPELKAGECVVICDTGADGRSFASNYGGSLGCAEFLLEEDGTVRQIRRRQTAEELLAACEMD